MKKYSKKKTQQDFYGNIGTSVVFLFYTWQA